MNMSTRVVDEPNNILQEFQNDTANETRSLVLNVLFRQVSITRKGKIRQELAGDENELISNLTNISIQTVHEICVNFLKKVKNLHDFLSTTSLLKGHDPRFLSRRVRVFLHILHRFAPIFDYYRAKLNLTILHKKLRKIVLWPRITTQLAVLIFVTDKNDEKTSLNGPILQNNLRYLTCCSAYAFHRTRNMLKL